MEKKLEEYLTQFPVYEYTFLDTAHIPFAEEVRTICKEECERYGTSWSCPPAVGSVEECRKKCCSYGKALFFSSVAFCENKIGFDAILETKKEHEAMTQSVYEFCKAEALDCMVLSSDSCSLCADCNYPNHACCFPEQLHPCIESHGIVVNKLTDLCHMDYMLDENHLLWFSILFF